MTTTERDSTMDTCECSEDYGPCETHSDVLAQREGAAVRLDNLGEADGTYRFLPLGRLADHVIRDVADSWGEHLFVFSLGGCWDPPCYTVRGEHFQDAWEWFLDYCATRDLLEDRTEYLSADERAAWESGNGLDGLEMVDGHAGLFDVSDIDGWQAR